jgi:hypothetical protein
MGQALLEAHACPATRRCTSRGCVTDIATVQSPLESLCPIDGLFGNNRAGYETPSHGVKLTHY